MVSIFVGSGTGCPVTYTLEFLFLFPARREWTKWRLSLRQSNGYQGAPKGRVAGTSMRNFSANGWIQSDRISRRELVYRSRTIKRLKCERNYYRCELQSGFSSL